MTVPSKGDNNQELAFDPSQFKLQPDGTFRISIRGMAAMAGVAPGGLSASLKSAVHENPLPCARSLVTQGFEPVHVSTWGETGGIPEDAAPFILEHYGINATSPSQRARAALLAFSRVGINAYLKDKLGIIQREQAPAAPLIDQQQVAAALSNVDLAWSILEKHGMCTDRDRIELKRDVRVLQQTCLMAAGSLPGTRAGVLAPAEDLPRFEGKVVDPELALTVVEFATCYLTPEEARAVSKMDSLLGRSVHAAYQDRHGEKAPTTAHLSTKAEQARKGFNLPVFGMAKNGNMVAPRIYRPADWDLVVEAIRAKGIIQPDRAAAMKADLGQFSNGLPVLA